MIKQIAFVVFILVGIGVGYLYADYLNKKQDSKIKAQMNEKELLKQIERELERDIKILNKKEVKQQNGRTKANSRGNAETERAITQDSQNTTNNSTREGLNEQSGGVSLPKDNPIESTNRDNVTDSRSINWH